MKKFFIFAVAAILVSCLLMAACTSPTTTTKSTSTSTSVATTTSAPAKPIELSLSYHMPPQSGFTKSILIPWATDLENATGGRVKIIHHAGGTLLGAPQVYDGIISGVCDMGVVDPVNYPGRFTRGEIMSLPLIFPNAEIAAIAYHEWLNKYCVNAELKDVKLLITTPMPDQNYMGNKPVQKLEDFKGLKLRGAGETDTAVMEALGSTAIAVATEDAFSALDTGMVDGTFFSWEGALIFGFADVTKYRTECTIYETCFQLVMNKQVFAKLPADIQKIFNDFSTPQVSRKYGAAFGATLPAARSALIAKDEKAGKTPMYVLPAAERARWVEAMKPVTASWIKKQGSTGQAMYDDIVSIVKKYSP